MVWAYIALGVLLAVALVLAVVRDLLDGRAGHRANLRGPYDPAEAHLGGPHVNLNPNLPHSDRDIRRP